MTTRSTATRRIRRAMRCRDRELSRRADDAHPRGARLHPGGAGRLRLGRARIARLRGDAGHELIVTSDKDGPDSELERRLPEADVVISQPFWPAYMTRERIAKAPNLKLIVTAGIGSDHTDLDAAVEAGITVAEVTYSNSISVSEHVVMMILGLVRNYIPSHQIVVDGGWNIADAVSRSYDLEGMQVGTVAAGRIGSAVLRRLKPFEVGLHYTDRHRLPSEVESELGATFHEIDRGHGSGDGRGDDQRAALRRDLGPVRRGDDWPDEARCLHRQHGARQDLQPRRDRRGARVGPARRATRATSGSRSRRRATIRGGRCPTRG